VLCWFLATAIVTIWFVFRDARFDHRLLLVGAVLPELDVVTGGAWVMHTLLFSVMLLVAVMIATTGRKPVRRVLLGLPIGTFLHLVFDGAWADTSTFWWPAGGSALDQPLRAAERGWWNVPLELAGVAVLAWAWRRGRLGDRARRRDFLASGRLALDTP